MNYWPFAAAVALFAIIFIFATRCNQGTMIEADPYWVRGDPPKMCWKVEDVKWCTRLEREQ
jgi:hypothetical protein